MCVILFVDISIAAIGQITRLHAGMRAEPRAHMCADGLMTRVSMAADLWADGLKACYPEQNYFFLMEPTIPSSVSIGTRQPRAHARV